MAQQARPPPAPAQAAAHAAAPHRLPDRPRRRAADVPDRLPRLVVVGFVDDKVVPLIPRRYDPENIFGRNIFGFGLLVFVSFTTLVGALAKDLIGRQILQFGESIVEPHPDRKADLQRPEADRRRRSSPAPATPSSGLPGRVSAQGPWSVAFIVHRIHREIAERDRRARPRLRLRPDDPQPHHRLPALRAAPRRRPPRHEPRGRDQAHHLRRPRHRAHAPPRPPQAAKPQLSRRRMAPRRPKPLAWGVGRPSHKTAIGRRERTGGGPMKIAVLGGDGFCGWPTALHLSDQRPRGPHPRQPLAAAGSTPSSASSR